MFFGDFGKRYYLLHYLFHWSFFSTERKIYNYLCLKQYFHITGSVKNAKLCPITGNTVVQWLVWLSHSNVFSLAHSQPISAVQLGVIVAWLSPENISEVSGLCLTDDCFTPDKVLSAMPVFVVLPEWGGGGGGGIWHHVVVQWSVQTSDFCQ